MEIIKEDNAFALCNDSGEKVGAVEFVEKGDHIVITHTRVNQELREQGLAAQLILKTVENARTHNLKVGASCSYAKAYLKNHEDEFEDILMK
ncbi:MULTISPECIES: GNAT family N-acetyltransferase [unclassified Lactococcus]|uniref:GNAT family N-acetyltransferase n=1 Tax=unclassified Lactococcus TaxID=2643510 RepID=UPI00164FFCB3|nr:MULTISPECIES: GNAT family N-acetyltransferase [unclassified Lactococcus]